jgi:hypothetical protein
MVQYLKAEENRIDYGQLDASRLEILKNFILTPYKYFSEKCQKTITDYIKFTHKSFPCYYFVSFNYTTVLDKCLTILHPQKSIQRIGSAEITHSIPKEALHIHGFLEDNVIMGIDNEAQIVNAELRSDSRLVHTIVKPVINDALENLTNDKIISYMNESNAICIFGMSIGSTDCSWWKKIGNWLKLSQSHNLLIFSKQGDFDKIHPENKIETMNYVKDSFLKYAENSEKIKRDQIHVCYEADMFALNLVE